MNWEKYIFPSNPLEAVQLLEKYEGARLIAGGTDLVLHLKRGLLKNNVMIDITRIKELNFIRQENDRILVGSTVTHCQLANSDLLLKKGRVLAEAARCVGCQQIRNVGTIGGNVVNAQPAADTVIALLALDAKVHILTSNGEVERDIEGIFSGPGKCSIDPSRELVICFSFSAPRQDESSLFFRYTLSEGPSLPLLNMGLWYRFRKERGVLEDVRIAMGPMSHIPFRARKTEDYLRGIFLGAESIKSAALLAAEEVQPRDSFRGSAAYKKKLVKVFLMRALNEAMKDNL